MPKMSEEWFRQEQEKLTNFGNIKFKIYTNSK